MFHCVLGRVHDCTVRIALCNNAVQHETEQTDVWQYSCVLNSCDLYCVIRLLHHGERASSQRLKYDILLYISDISHKYMASLEAIV